MNGQIRSFASGGLSVPGDFWFLIILIIVGIILYKADILVITVKNSFKYVKIGRKIKTSYKGFHGLETYNYWLKKDTTWTLHYQVNVEKGSLHLELKNIKGSLFKKDFESDDQGTFTFSTDGKYHWLKINGKKTKGGYRMNLKKSKPIQKEQESSVENY